MSQEIEKFEKYFIIGNGFDINFGLKSSYNDFINYYMEKKELDEKGLYQHNNLFSRNLKQYNWNDFEEQYRTMFQNYNSLENAQEKQKLQDDLNQKLHQIEIEFMMYLDEEMENYKNIRYSKKLDNFWKQLFKLDDETTNLKKIGIDNFNYTDILYLLNDENKDDFNHLEITNIHGSLLNRNILFGAGDEGDITPNLITKSGRIMTIDESQKRNDEIKTLYIIGHSVIGSDLAYIKDKINKSEQVILFYYNNDYVEKLSALAEYNDKVKLFPIPVAFNEKEVTIDLELRKAINKSVLKQYSNIHCIDERDSRNELIDIYPQNPKNFIFNYQTEKLNIAINSIEEINFLLIRLKNTKKLDFFKLKLNPELQHNVHKEFDEVLKHLKSIKIEIIELENIIINENVIDKLSNIRFVKLIECPIVTENNNELVIKNEIIENFTIINNKTVGTNYTLVIDNVKTIKKLFINDIGCNVIFKEIENKITSLNLSVDSISCINKVKFDNIKHFEVNFVSTYDLENILLNPLTINSLIIENIGGDNPEDKINLEDIFIDRINYLPNLIQISLNNIVAKENVYGYLSYKSNGIILVDNEYYQPKYITRHDNNENESSENLTLLKDISNLKIINTEKTGKIEQLKLENSILIEEKNKLEIKNETLGIENKNLKTSLNNLKEKYENEIKSEKIYKRYTELGITAYIDDINNIFNKYDLAINASHIVDLVEKQANNLITKSNSNEYYLRINKLIPDNNLSLKQKREIKEEIFNLIDNIT